MVPAFEKFLKVYKLCSLCNVLRRTTLVTRQPQHCTQTDIHTHTRTRAHTYTTHTKEQEPLRQANWSEFSNDLTSPLQPATSASTTDLSGRTYLLARPLDPPHIDFVTV